MEFQRNILKVNSVTLTVTLLAAIGNVRCQSQFSHNYSAVQEQIDALTKARYLLFPHIYRAFIDAGRSPSDYNVSSGCQGDLTRYYWALSQEKAWAWRLYDATGKQGAGLFMGALTWKGNLHECLDTLQHGAASVIFSEEEDTPRAQYCSIFLQTPQWLVDAFKALDLPFPVPLTPFIADVCVPASCTEQDLSHLVQTFVTASSWGSVSFTVNSTRCFKGRDISDDPAAICTALLLAALAFCVGCGTAYDIYRRRRKVRVKTVAEYTIGYKKDTKQYGILKVILAPPTKRQMRRRNTIGGYEQPDRYRLSEIRVDRQTLLLKGKTPSSPDITSVTSSTQDGAKRPPNDVTSVRCSSQSRVKPLANNVTSVTSSTQDGAKPLANNVTSGARSTQHSVTALSTDVTSVTSSTQDGPTPVAYDVTSHKDSAAAEISQNGSQNWQKTANMVRIEEKEKAITNRSVEKEAGTRAAADNDVDRVSSTEKETNTKAAKNNDTGRETSVEKLTNTQTATYNDTERDTSIGKETNTQTATDNDTGRETSVEKVTNTQTATYNDTERDTSIGKETNTQTATDNDTGRETSVGKETNTQLDDLTYIDNVEEDEDNPDPEAEMKTPLLNHTSENDTKTDNPEPRAEMEKPLLNNNGVRDTKTDNPGPGAEMKTRLLNHNGVRDTKTDNPGPGAEMKTRLLNHNGVRDTKTDYSDPRAETKTPLLNHSGVRDTETEPSNTGRLPVSDPGVLHTVSQAGDRAARAAGQMEVEVPAPSPGPRSPHEARMPSSPSRTIKHIPAFATQGSVFERQMSVSSDEDSPFDSTTGHTLYDIPEESPEDNGNEIDDVLHPEIVIREKPIKKAVGLLRSIVLSFSFRRSTKRVMAEGSPDTLFCLNGVRVLSIGWIVLGNVYMTLYLNPDVVDNHVDAVQLTQKLWVQAVINTTLAADSFYILSGTLGAYNFMKLKKNFKGKKMSEVMTFKEYFIMIFHRLIRIGPCYWLVLLLFTNLMPYLGEGPRWSYEITSVQTCKDKWWANALFFSNFYQADSMCMPHTYYLVNDFQFALLMPLLMIPLLCMPEIGFMLLAGVVVVQILSTLILNQGINGNVLRMQDTDYFSTVYVKPYCRMGVYAIGLGLGYILYVTKREIKFRKIPLVISWTLSLVVVVLLPYITFLENRAGGRNWSGMETAVFEAVSRPLWGLALSWIIFACSVGQGAFVNKLLSWNAFLPLCRITYGVYLLHPMLISIVISSRHNGIYIHFTELTYEFIADVVLSYLLAFVLITFVECPFASLETNIRAHGIRRKQK